MGRCGRISLTSMAEREAGLRPTRGGSSKRCWCQRHWNIIEHQDAPSVTIRREDEAAVALRSSKMVKSADTIVLL